MKIFIGGLPKDITETDLKEAFEEFGEVSSSKIVSDKATGISRGFGFVEMPSHEAGLRSIEVLHEAIVDGSTVSVKIGEERPEKGSINQKKPFAKPGFKRKPNSGSASSKPYNSRNNSPKNNHNGNTATSYNGTGPISNTSNAANYSINSNNINSSQRPVASTTGRRPPRPRTTR